jgi:hypothetical protein
MLNAEDRLRGVEQLIDSKQYFVIHAARQSGKTTCLLDLTDRLNKGGKYHAAYCSLETLQSFTDPQVGIPQILNRIKSAISMYKLPHFEQFAQNADKTDVAGVIQTELTKYCSSLDKPLIILFDEADCLSEGTLITFLRQLRNGFVTRGAAPFVHSLALVGMRNIRDYKAHIRGNNETLGSASPFNIVTESLTLKNFTKEQIAELYMQHTNDTEQVFESSAIDLVWQKTQGQPWLVNAIAREVIVKLLDWDYTKPVTAELCEQAIKNIILRRDVHIDSLLERLKEPRVQRVIEPMLAGETVKTNTDDFAYTLDLGLIRRNEDKQLEPANPIYGEVIFRTLNEEMQSDLEQTRQDLKMPRYYKDGQIDMDLLLSEFQQFWRENGDVWLKKTDYIEIAPHLLLQAFLQRIINGGGQVVREPASGNGRLDLYVLYEDKKYPIEIKIRYGEKTLPDGLTQLARYMDIYGEKRGWLCIFDRRTEISWEEKIYIKSHSADNDKTITIVGL